MNKYYIKKEVTGDYSVYDWKNRQLRFQGDKTMCEEYIDRQMLHEKIEVEPLGTGNLIFARHSRNKMTDVLETLTENNTVNKPNHYIGDLGLEVEEVLRNFMPRYENAYVAHRVSSAIEYLLRSPYKNGAEDIEKARYNLNQALEYIEDSK